MSRFVRRRRSRHSLRASVSIPGVRAVTYSYNGLFGGTDNGDAITVEGYTAADAREIGSSYDAVAPGYFSTLGIPVLIGREITEQDQSGGRMVCVINETFAKRFFDGRNPIGLHVTQRYAERRNTYEVVGVVARLASEPPARRDRALASTRPRPGRRHASMGRQWRHVSHSAAGGAAVLADVRQRHPADRAEACRSRGRRR